MIFAIDESGDLDIDKENRSFTNIVNGDTLETYFKQARTVIITNFIHNNFFKDNFIKGLRNNFSDEAINDYIDTELNRIFYFDTDILSYVKYLHINSGSEFKIYFHFSSGDTKKKILNYNVTL
jgi:hypothetical protein